MRDCYDEQSSGDEHATEAKRKRTVAMSEIADDADKESDRDVEGGRKQTNGCSAETIPFLYTGNHSVIDACARHALPYHHST